MHSPLTQSFSLLSALFIGLILISLEAFAEDNIESAEKIYKEQVALMKTPDEQPVNHTRSPDEEVNNEELEEALEDERPPLVEVEPSNILPGDVANSYALVPYKVRRNDWGAYFGLSYSLFEPTNYESDFISPTLGDFEQLFGGADSKLLELVMAIKYNFFLGSLSGEFKVGTYTASADEVATSDLSLTMVSVGGKYAIDNILFEPWIVPYITVGVYTVLYSEEQGSYTFDGNTQPAPFYAVGGLFQLDWLDKASALESYIEAGIENTFIFTEMRQFIASSVGQDPDFGTDFHVNAGLVVEF